MKDKMIRVLRDVLGIVVTLLYLGIVIGGIILIIWHLAGKGYHIDPISISLAWVVFCVLVIGWIYLLLMDMILPNKKSK